jgi:hypothetical protein
VAADGSGLKPYWGKPAVRNFRGVRGNVSHGLVAICHEAPKGGYSGSHWPKRRRAFVLLNARRSRNIPEIQTDPLPKKPCFAVRDCVE